MMFCVTKGGNLCYAIMYKVIWANQMTKYFAYRRSHTLSMLDVTCILKFVVPLIVGLGSSVGRASDWHAGGGGFDLHAV